MMNGKYREDIDRLRGLAVLSVVAFHFDAPAIYGGFVGVDIFFVISGFLITQIIQRETREGIFSFARFYERRIRRLLPALYVMVLAAAVPAFYFLLPSERTSFFRSVTATVTFTSNLFFWSEAGYFDHSAVEKPLLHTWSLAVEEQFYLVLPVLMWALLRIRSQKRLLPVWLVSAAIISFAVGEWLLKNGHINSAFYMSPGRAWEFLIGSIVALDSFPTLRTQLSRTTVLTVAYLLILVSIFGLRQTSLYPGWNALAPCVGAALFIWSGNGVPSVTRNWFSPLEFSRQIGRMSYSLYLWHWPIFTFARFAKTDLTLTPAEKIGLFAATFAISFVSWKFVELPFRNRRILPTRKTLFASSAVATVFLVFIASVGVLERAPDTEFDRRIARFDAFNNFDQRAYRSGTCFQDSLVPIDVALCLTPVKGKTNVLLWGNSHAAHYYPGIASVIEQRSINLMQATIAGCMPKLESLPTDTFFCRDFSEMMTRWFASNRPDLVIMSSDWIEHARSGFDGMINSVRNSISILTKQGVRVILLGPSVQFKTGLPSLLSRAFLRHLDPLPAKEMVRSDIFDFDARMKNVLPSTALFTYVSVVGSICPDRECALIVDEDAPLVCAGSTGRRNTGIKSLCWRFKLQGLPWSFV
jgi:peptidoglycan/LPS O-acetylase OafA/YrhL